MMMDYTRTESAKRRSVKRRWDRIMKIIRSEFLDSRDDLFTFRLAETREIDRINNREYDHESYS